MSRGWCRLHYERWRATGDPLKTRKPWSVKKQGICSIKGCGREHEGRGFCTTHHRRWKQYGDPQADKPIRGWRQQGCSIPDCDGQYYSNGWCMRHYGLWRLHGDPTKQVYASPGQADHYHDGYHLIHVDGHVVREHRYVMEQHLGRLLLPGENVHHKDGNRSRNTIDNLELWVTKQPKGQRVTDLLAWAREIIAQYEPIEEKL